MLSSCGGRIESRTVVTRAENAPQAGRYQLDMPANADDPALAALEARALEAALPQLVLSGWQSGGADASHNLVIALSSRPANLALNAGADVIAPAKQQKLGQNCADTEHRLVLAFVDRKTGVVAQRITVSEADCRATLAEVAEQLAGLAAIGLRLPPGEHRSTRSGRD